MKEFKDTVSQVCLQISTVQERIRSKDTANQEEVDHAFEALRNTLDINRWSMKSRLAQQYQAALDNLSKQKCETESVQAETAHVATLIESILQGKDEILLSQEDLVGKNLDRLQKQVEQLSLTVSEPPLPVPEIMNSGLLQTHLDASNFLYIPADPKKCQVEGDFLRSAETGKNYILTVNLVDSKGNKCPRRSQKIKAELRSIRDDTRTLGTTKQTSQSSESVSILFESQKRGRKELSVTVNGNHIAKSPQSIYVHMPPSQLSQPIAQVRNLDRPTGITRSGNSILAIEHSRNRILKFNTAYEVVAVYGGQGQLQGPSELTTDRHENIYICTVYDHMVHKFTRNDTHIKSAGTMGELPGQFNFPNGIRISNQDELYICDSNNNRIQVLDLQLRFKRVFGSAGSGKGQFSFPSDVDFDSSGNIYIVDSNNHRIQVFSPQESYIRVIGYKRFGSSELKNPVNMHVVNDLLFVTEFKKNYITVFKTSG